MNAEQNMAVMKQIIIQGNNVQ